MLRLADADKPPSPELGKTAAQDRVTSYLRSFRDFYSRDLLHPTVRSNGNLSERGQVQSWRRAEIRDRHG
jgi:hypothetical protein